MNKGDFGVRIRHGDGKGTIPYPDVVVDIQSDRGDERATTTAIVVAEVLSPNTDLAHHIKKLAKYAVLDSLKQYLVFDQKRPVVHVWTRDESGWPDKPLVVAGLDRAIASPHVRAVLHLDGIYRRSAPKGMVVS